MQSDKSRQVEVELRQELKHSQEQYAELYSQYVALDSQSAKKDSSLQWLTLENSELKTKNTMVEADLAALQEVKNTLERKLSLLQQTVEEQQKRWQDEVPHHDHLSEITRMAYQDVYNVLC